MINILLCGNRGVFDGMLTLLISLLKRGRCEEGITLYIFTMDLSDIDGKYLPLKAEHAELLTKVMREHGVSGEVILSDVTELYNEHFRGCPNEGAYCSPYTLIRLLADLVPDMPDKLLYLDCDLLFNRDAELLYSNDVSEVDYAAARDRYGKLLVSPNYINAGVLLLNLARIKKDGLFARARTILKERRLTFADQSALIRARGERIILPQKFNQQKRLTADTVVFHFSKRLIWLPFPHTVNIKQWHISSVHKVLKCYGFDDILFEYLYYKEAFRRENG